jgi:hypothetical protein
VPCPEGRDLWWITKVEVALGRSDGYPVTLSLGDTTELQEQNRIQVAVLTTGIFSSNKGMKNSAVGHARSLIPAQPASPTRSVTVRTFAARGYVTVRHATRVPQEAVHIPGSARTRHRFGDEVRAAATSSWQERSAPRGDHRRTLTTRVTSKIDT